MIQWKWFYRLRDPVGERTYNIYVDFNKGRTYDLVYLVDTILVTIAAVTLVFE